MTIPCSKGINIVPEEQAENSTNVEMETEQVKQMHVHALAKQKISKFHSSCTSESEENVFMQRLISLESTIKVQNSTIRKGNDDIEVSK